MSALANDAPHGSCATRALGRYFVHDEIAAGGMATVHLARMHGARGFRRTVAAKRLRPQLACDDAFARALGEQAQRAARVRHPNVVSTLDVTHVDGALVLVMEYVHGASLGSLTRSVHARGHEIPPAVAVAIAIGVLHGLHAVHEARDEHGQALGLVHGEVSPGNILVGSDGVARIGDLALARATATLSRETSAGARGYAAPEQHGGQPAGPAADVFAVARVLSELLGGTLPDERSGLRVRARPAAAPRHDAALALDAIVARGLARDPAARFATARDMALALEQSAPARRHEVAAWAERAAGTALARRAEAIETLERADQPDIEPVWLEPREPTDATDHAPTSERASDAASPRRPVARGPILSIAAALALGAAAGLWFGWAPSEERPPARPAVVAAPVDVPAPPGSLEP